jgi:hypothetical protein
MFVVMMLTPVACNGCGRFFMTEDPDATIAALTGSCGCGGRFSTPAASPRAPAHDGAAGSWATTMMSTPPTPVRRGNSV